MLAINESALRYWRETGYDNHAIDDLCVALDSNYLAMRVIFNGSEQPDITVTNRTGASGAGHYPTMIKVIEEVLKDWEGEPPIGRVVILLEDGIYPGIQHFSRRAPLLTFGKSTRDHYSLVIPDPGFWESDAYSKRRADIARQESKISWKDKKSVLYWRGAGSGLGMNGPQWKEADRIKLCLKCKELQDPRFDAYLSKVVDYEYRESKEQPYGLGIVRAFVPFEEFLNYKYLVDVDGISCAWLSCYLKLVTNCTLVKVQSDNMQWYYDKLIPWHNYVPISADFSDVSDVLDWLESNDSCCEKIALAGKEVVQSMNTNSEKKALEDLIKELLCYQRG